MQVNEQMENFTRDALLQKGVIQERNCAGIIPIANFKISPHLPDALLPIGENFTLIDRAILELATFGVDSIWIVCPEEQIAALRVAVGENIVDPRSLFETRKRLTRVPGSSTWTNAQFWEAVRGNLKTIPIYFIPVHPSDRGIRRRNRDFLLWYITYGVYAINNILRRFSDMAVPDSYQVAFLHGVHSLMHLYRRKFRTIRRLRSYSHRANGVTYFSLRYNGRHIVRGNYLGFSFGNDLYEVMREYLLTLGLKFDDWNVSRNRFMEEYEAFVRSRKKPTKDERYRTNRYHWSLTEIAHLRARLKAFGPRKKAIRKNTNTRREVHLREFFSIFTENFFDENSRLFDVFHYHEIVDWRTYEDYLAYRARYRSENRFHEWYDVKPSFMRYLRLGRTGYDGIAVNPERLKWADFFREIGQGVAP
jgi:hypothetical protein